MSASTPLVLSARPERSEERVSKDRGPTGTLRHAPCGRALRVRRVVAEPSEFASDHFLAPQLLLIGAERGADEVGDLVNLGGRYDQRRRHHQPFAVSAIGGSA